MLALFTLAPAHDFKNCAATDHAHVTAVDLSPDPPVPGQHVIVTATGTCAQPKRTHEGKAAGL